MVCLLTYLVFLLFFIKWHTIFKGLSTKKLSFFYIVHDKISSIHTCFKLRISVFPHCLCKNNLCSFLVLSKFSIFAKKSWVFKGYEKAANAFRQLNFQKIQPYTPICFYMVSDQMLEIHWRFERNFLCLTHSFSKKSSAFIWFQKENLIFYQ